MRHSSTQKASMIAGVKYRSIPVSTTGEHAWTDRGLKKALKSILAEALVPFYLTVTLGTTSTCAVDRFKDIAEVKKECPNLWTCGCSACGSSVDLGRVLWSVRRTGDVQ